MMANWDLTRIERDLGHLQTPLYLVVGEGDLTVSPREASRVCERLPSAELMTLPGLGHLAHEEQPADVATVVRRIAARLGLFEQS